jgi:hypothetical protein
MPKGKEIDRRNKMKRWVRRGMAILLLGVIIQIMAMCNNAPF